MPATKPKKKVKPAKTPVKKGPTYLKILRDSLDGYDRNDLARNKERELREISRQAPNFVDRCIANGEGVPIGMFIRVLARVQATKALANVEDFDSDAEVKEALEEILEHLHETRVAINTMLHSLGGDVAVATNATQRSAEEGFDLTGNS